MDITGTPLRSPRAILLLVVFVAVVLGVGIAIAVSNPPGAWYQALVKPPFNPPNWVFAPAWTLLYIMIAIAGWRTFLPHGDGLSMRLWFLQMALNWAWSPAWFSLHWRWGSVAIIAVLWLAILGFILASRHKDVVAAWLFAPYLAWVSFAALLNVSLVALNP
jgi:benzodiazapine receptor